MVVFALILSVVNAGVLTHTVVEPIVKAAALQGPSSRSTVVGPDGSVIEAVAPGGRVETAIDAGVAAYSAPIVTHAVPAAAGAIVAHHAPTVVSARLATVPTVAAVNGLVSSAYGVKTLVASPLTASGYPLYAPGSGLEGQYVHDYTEKLYDDGSYKGEIY